MAKTVLVVDDSPTMRQMVAFTLTSAGYQVVEAGNGKEAVGKVNGGAKPDLVVTDLNMPEMDGITLIKEIRKMPTGWIVKPFNPEQMMAVIKKVLPG